MSQITPIHHHFQDPEVRNIMAQLTAEENLHGTHDSRAWTPGNDEIVTTTRDPNGVPLRISVPTKSNADESLSDTGPTAKRTVT
jgi:hypothetical protein